MQIEKAFVEDNLLHTMQVFPRVRAVYDATTRHDAHTSHELRQQIMAYAINPQAETLAVLPILLQDYIAKVTEASHKVTDADIDSLKNAGYSEDHLYEITVTASLGSGIRRYQAGMSALENWGA